MDKIISSILHSEVNLAKSVHDDFQLYTGVLSDSFNIKPSHDTYATLSIVHESVFLLNNFCHNAFYLQDEALNNYQTVSIHLLNRAVVCSLQGDTELSSFALRGSLEAAGSQSALLNTKPPLPKFSNNLEANVSEFKQEILTRADLRTNTLNKHNYPLIKKRTLKNSFNNFTAFGRETLYGNLSEIIHVRAPQSNQLSSTLIDIANQISFADASASSLNLISETAIYELMMLQLNIKILEERRIPASLQEYIIQYFTVHPIGCTESFLNLWKTSMVFL